MAVQIALNTPLADSLNSILPPKLVEVGWATAGSDDSALSEYIILMLVNGKTQDDIAKELASDLLGLEPDDPGARDFATWLFEQIGAITAQQGGVSHAPTVDTAGASQDAVMDGDGDANMNATGDGPAEINAPTGPKSMRNGNMRGGREKRMMGQINRTLGRNDDVLHRVRGNERVNSHRGTPNGPRMGVGRQPRTANGRATNFAAGLAQMGAMGPMGPSAMNGPMSGGMPDMNGWMGPGQPQQPGMDIMSILEQQSRIMQQMQQQLMMQGQGGGQRGRGKPLSERVQNPRGNFRRGPHQQQSQEQPAGGAAQENAGEGGDIEMGQAKREAPNPDDTVCRFNLRCSNKDCKYAHQSPAAPPGVTVDLNDVCSYGAACKNRKCVARHPSPASKVAHQSEQDCKFYPNCQNPACPFRHPSIPPCRNGGDCTVANCKFTHVQTKCKFNPCTNRYCLFKHDEGQRGVFQDKVWTAEGGKDNVAERKFVDESAAEELVIPGSDSGMSVDRAAAQDAGIE